MSFASANKGKLINVLLLPRLSRIDSPQARMALTECGCSRCRFPLSPPGSALAVAPGALLRERLGDAVGFHVRVGIEDGAHGFAGTPPGGKIRGVGQAQN